MGPKVIYLIRHGEKPGDALTESEDDGVHLSEAGRCRAAALAWQKDRLFGGNVDGLVAAAPSRHSRRCVETATPLARALGLKLKRKWACEEVHRAVVALLGKGKYRGKTLVICWHHEELPSLISALGGSVAVQPIQDGQWQGHRFDRIIKLTFNADATVTTESLPQGLLFGDTWP